MKERIFAVALATCFSPLACNSDPTPGAGGGLDESQLAEDSSLRAAFDIAVAVHLESPAGGEMAEDTRATGSDAIPYRINFDSERVGRVEFCFDYPEPHVLTVEDASGTVLAGVTAGEGCATAPLERGEYVFRLIHDPYASGDDVDVSQLFVRSSKPASGADRRVTVSADCTGCDLGGAEITNADFGDSGSDLREADLAEADLSGSHFAGADLSNAHFGNTVLTDTRLWGTGANFTGALVRKMWAELDALIVFSFNAQYPYDGSLPTLEVELDADLERVWLTPDTVSESHPLTLDVTTRYGETIRGTFSVITLETSYYEDDRAIWGDFSYTAGGVENRFQGVMRTFHSTGKYSNPSEASDAQHAGSASLRTASSVQLRLINQSSDVNNSSIVVFQKNVASSFGEVAVAWRVIPSRPGETHDVAVSRELSTDVTVSEGDRSNDLLAEEGKLYSVSLTTSGAVLADFGQSTNPNTIQVRNALVAGAISANIYRNGQLLFSRTALSPDQKADFPVDMQFYVAVMNDVAERDVMNSAVLNVAPTGVFNLLGIGSADIIIEGGGAANAPFSFRMANVVQD